LSKLDFEKRPRSSNHSLWDRHLSFVIPRACDFPIFSCFLHTQPAVFQAPDKAVILSEALRRSIANRGLMARSRRTPAMLVGRCSRELSGRKLQLKIKSHKRRAVEGSAVPRTSPGNAGYYAQAELSSRVSWTDGSGTLQVTFVLPFLFVTVWS
jgi:hypothetical protein